MVWQSFALGFRGELKFAPFMNIIIGLVNLDTSATLIERIKVWGKKENWKQSKGKFGGKKRFFSPSEYANEASHVCLETKNTRGFKFSQNRNFHLQIHLQC